LLDLRFEILKRDAEIKLLREQVTAYESGKKVNSATDYIKLYNQLKNLNKDRNFIHKCNIGNEFMSDEFKARVKKIAKYRWINPKNEESDLLSENELYNLCISKGTLNPEERNIINRHINVSIEMLNSLPYPEHLKNIPEYAGGHHERMDGKGYPKGLTREEMPIQTRIMGIADIFEALTARDRPYKKAMPLSQALKILGNMKLDNHIDPDLFNIFISEKVYLKYAEKYLLPEQIDYVNINKLPGYNSIEA
jgi:hypothetical protein